MKKSILLLTIIVLPTVFSLQGCKSAAKAVAKHWTKKQIKKFARDCEGKVGKHFSSEKVAPFCDCAAQNISQNLDLDKANALDAMNLIREAGKCALENR